MGGTIKLGVCARNGDAGNSEAGDANLVLGVKVLDDVARAASLDDAVGDRDGVDAVAVGALVGATVLGARHVEL